MSKQKVLWDKIKQSVAEGMSTAAEKTEEYTKLGKAKLDVLAIKRKISKQFTELGGLAYEASKDKKPQDAFKTPEVSVIVETIAELEAELAEKETQFEELKKTAE
jgi:hypothetical protein